MIDKALRAAIGGIDWRAGHNEPHILGDSSAVE